MVQKIEEKICNYFGIDKRLVVGKNNIINASLARGYLWYILHYNCGMSVNAIAKHYQRNPRSVHKLIAKVKYLVTTQKLYKEHYEKIKQL
jgi:chromosomal replication initiation ATPase DnaA